MLWLIIGLIVGAGAYWLVSWTRANKISVKWYEWLIAFGAAVSALLAVQNVEGSVAELEMRAAWTLLAGFGFIAVFLAIVAWRLVARHNAKAG
jgi:hypothetical protein